jgi:hypothetical protein
MAANGRPSDAAFARAGVLIAAALNDLAERRLDAAEAEREHLFIETASRSDQRPDAGYPTRKPHNSPQSTQIEEIETDPKSA